MNEVSPKMSSEVLHAVVGHKFPVYFMNAIRSVLAMAPNDEIMVVDNASNSAVLLRELTSLEASEPRVKLMLRDSNDISRNKKVGGLYDAYNEVISYAIARGFKYLHIMQNDMQMLWWHEDIIQRAIQIYSEYPECVNIYTVSLPRYVGYSDGLDYVKPDLVCLRHYGLTDAGLYDLTKWRRLNMKFEDREQLHARKYLSQGLRVFCHPYPTVAQIPWPAVVRNGRIVGREVKLHEEFLLRPLTIDEQSFVKSACQPVWLEDVCVPWGWTCLTPYWVTDLRSIDYWIARYRDARAHGLRVLWPRWECRGLPKGKSILNIQRQPRLWFWQVLTQPIWHSALRMIQRSRLSNY